MIGKRSSYAAKLLKRASFGHWRTTKKGGVIWHIAMPLEGGVVYRISSGHLRSTEHRRLQHRNAAA
jgi:hypothetical protein